MLELLGTRMFVRVQPTYTLQTNHTMMQILIHQLTKMINYSQHKKHGLILANITQYIALYPIFIASYIVSTVLPHAAKPPPGSAPLQQNFPWTTIQKKIQSRRHVKKGNTLIFCQWNLPFIKSGQVKGMHPENMNNKFWSKNVFSCGFEQEV